GAPGKKGRPLIEDPGPRGVRARALSLALAENVAVCARKAPHQEADPPADANTQLTRILSQMSTTLGSIASGRLSKALTQARDEHPSEVRGYASGSAIAIVQPLALGTERIYLGPAQVGLTTLVTQSAPEVDRHMRALFGAANAALTRADAPSASPEIRATAQAAVRALDVAI